MLEFLERVPEYGSIMLMKGGSELLELELKLDEALGSKQISDMVGFCALQLPVKPSISSHRLSESFFSASSVTGTWLMESSGIFSFTVVLMNPRTTAITGTDFVVRFWGLFPILSHSGIHAARRAVPGFRVTGGARPAIREVEPFKVREGPSR